MCIRYELDFERVRGGSRKLDLQAMLGIRDSRLDMFPARRAPIIWRNEGGVEAIDAQWGFTPFWAKDVSFGKKSGYNARSETVFEKPTWRKAIKKQRCIVPATGFYERIGKGPEMRWRRFRQVDGVLMIAALYEGPTKLIEVPTFALVTTLPNEVVEEAHDRMPVVLSPDDVVRWLDPEAPAEELRTLMLPCPPVWLTWEDAGAVGKKVGAAESSE